MANAFDPLMDSIRRLDIIISLLLLLCPILFEVEPFQICVILVSPEADFINFSGPALWHTRRVITWRLPYRTADLLYEYFQTVAENAKLLTLCQVSYCTSIALKLKSTLVLDADYNNALLQR